MERTFSLFNEIFINNQYSIDNNYRSMVLYSNENYITRHEYLMM